MQRYREGGRAAARAALVPWGFTGCRGTREPRWPSCPLPKAGLAIKYFFAAGALTALSLNLHRITLNVNFFTSVIIFPDGLQRVF